MKTLTQIQEQIAAGAFEFSRHAFRRMVERNISEQEIHDPNVLLAQYHAMQKDIVALRGQLKDILEEALGRFQ